MRVNILRGVVVDGKGYQAGQEADLKENTARLLIDIGKAEKAEAIAAPVESSAISESPNESPVNRMETAPVKRGRKSKQVQ
jgi:hypothetical protein